MMTLTIAELYAVYIKIRTILFSILTNLIKKNFSSVKSYKYLNKVISIKTMVLTVFEILCLCAQSL